MKTPRWDGFICRSKHYGSPKYQAPTHRPSFHIQASGRHALSSPRARENTSCRPMRSCLLRRGTLCARRKSCRKHTGACWMRWLRAAGRRRVAAFASTNFVFYGLHCGMCSSDAGMIHIIGAGLAGLAAALRLAGSGRLITIHEATAQAGGRCRSYQDQATGMLIDNGTHLLLSGNQAALSYAKTIGSDAGLRGPSEAEFPFLDLANDEQWTLRFGDGRFPWWVLDKNRRVPQTGVIDYLPLVRLAWSPSERPIGAVMTCAGPIYQRLLEPFLLAALNIAPRDGSTKLAGALIRETLALGGQACRPLLAQDGIGNVFVEPAVGYLQQRGVSVTLQDELLGMQFSGGRVTQLDFAERQINLAEGDSVILAVPPYIAIKLVPNLRAPSSFC